jgi:hydroxyethylthiazole kinase-like uncharacterized protein yjeF
MEDLSMNIPPQLAVLSVGEMYAADKAAEAAGIASIDLMEAAGAAIARVVQARWKPQVVAVLCGPGYNGGDGFVVARLLAEAGWDVRLALLGKVEDLRGDAATNAARWRGKVLPLTTEVLDGRPLVIDALFGAGLKRALSGAARAVIELVNDEGLTCIAVDVPSGVHGDTGQILKSEDGAEIAPRCVASVTFFRPKPGHMLFPGRALCGDVTVADIGIPASVLDVIRPRTASNTPALWTLPQPSWRDHKYHRGHAIVVGGADMTGAARLAARAARRAGVGLLTLGVPSSALPIYAADAPGAFVQAVDTAADFGALLADPRRNAALIGPGCGVGLETSVRVLKILGFDRAVVLDADALTSFEDDPQQLFKAIARHGRPVVLTPHHGEFVRLFGIVGVEGKLAQARAAAAASGAVVIYKGADTVVAAPDGRAAIASNAPPWLATGGSGDVLAGFVTGLLAQGMAGWEAACAAVWLHGAAAGLLGRGLIAEDLPEALPKVLESL